MLITPKTLSLSQTALISFRLSPLVISYKHLSVSRVRHIFSPRPLLPAAHIPYHHHCPAISPLVYCLSHRALSRSDISHFITCENYGRCDDSATVDYHYPLSTRNVILVIWTIKIPLPNYIMKNCFKSSWLLVPVLIWILLEGNTWASCS